MISAIWMEVLRVDDANDVRFSLNCLNICNNLVFDVGRAFVCDILFEINHFLLPPRACYSGVNWVANMKSSKQPLPFREKEEEKKAK